MGGHSGGGTEEVRSAMPMRTPNNTTSSQTSGAQRKRVTSSVNSTFMRAFSESNGYASKDKLG